MIKHESRNNALPLEKLAEASGRGLLNYTPGNYTYGAATRRQKKHDMLLTFMENAKTQKQKRRSAPVKPKLLSALLSLFI